MKGDGRRFYLVTERDGRVSVHCFESSGDSLTLTERFAAGGMPRSPMGRVPLQGFFLRNGKVAFLFDFDIIIVCTLIGIFSTLAKAIDCWISNGLEPDDPRWIDITGPLKQELSGKASVVGRTFSKRSGESNVLHMRIAKTG